jgi:hypothetical protein
METCITCGSVLHESQVIATINFCCANCEREWYYEPEDEICDCGDPDCNRPIEYTAY